MTSWDRLKTDNSGKILIPMNVDGGIKDANFLNGYKLAVLIIAGLGSFAFLAYIFDAEMGWIINTLMVLFTLYIDSVLLRYCIFEEKYYSKIYKKMKKYEVTTADIFWNVANLRDSEFGTTIVYSDLKVGVLIKLERDTVIGKPFEYKLNHYDALSEFYKELNVKSLNFVQFSLMESTGKDPRLNMLEEMIVKAGYNKNLEQLIEMQLGHTKNITRVTLFESDYILIYTEQPSRADYILQEAMECCEKLIGSSFIEYRILNKSDIIDLMRELYDIKYFDHSQAILRMFSNDDNIKIKAFDIIGLEFMDGTVKELDNTEKMRLNRVQELLDEGTVKASDWSIKEALNGKLKNVGNDSGVGFKHIDYTDKETEEYRDINTVLFNDDVLNDNRHKENSDNKENKSVTDLGFGDRGGLDLNNSGSIIEDDLGSDELNGLDSDIEDSSDSDTGDGAIDFGSLELIDEDEEIDF